ncbi:hypothetical protein GTP81_16730 [Rugamonas sp. FT107W]|uniref:HEAT repeat domain-containing protein n=1 Tax=Duganella vulcania TaxID=2692166 RepID=A0A845HI85_9BURK|nr:hypothetical protein [Duganella vulcania]MYN18398.1 hypothetical protein [Duganella vulcania]
MNEVNDCAETNGAASAFLLAAFLCMASAGAVEGNCAADVPAMSSRKLVDLYKDSELDDIPSRVPLTAEQLEYVGCLFSSMLDVIEQKRSLGENDSAFGQGKFFWPKEPSKPIKSSLSFEVDNFKFRSISIGFTRKGPASEWSMAGLRIHPRNFPHGVFEMRLPKSFFGRLVFESSHAEERKNESVEIVNVFWYKKETNGRTINLRFEADPRVSDLKEGYPRSFHSVAIYLGPNLEPFTKELATGSTDVRENIVRQLETLGLEMDVPAPDKFAVIRDHSIMRALAVGGFAKDDAAADRAAQILLDRCTPSDLAAFAPIYTASLRQLKGDYLRIAAKAKTVEARQFVEKMALQAKWRDQPERRQAIRLTQAALGNTRIENEFIDAAVQAERSAPPAPRNRFYNVGTARDGTELAERLQSLGRIGTRRSLLAACGYLRSPLKSYVRDVSERSVRYAALDALLYNYPDERLLHGPKDHAGWIAAEQFCTRNLGAVFDGPTPDLPPDQPYPTRMLTPPSRK